MKAAINITNLTTEIIPAGRWRLVEVANRSDVAIALVWRDGDTLNFENGIPLASGECRTFESGGYDSVPWHESGLEGIHNSTGNKQLSLWAI